MSGGSYDYAYIKVLEFASDVRGTGFSTVSIALRNRFADHLEKCAKAMHTIEWIDSFDKGPGDEDDLIADVLQLGDSSKASILVEEAQRLIDESVKNMQECWRLIKQDGAQDDTIAELREKIAEQQAEINDLRSKYE